MELEDTPIIERLITILNANGIDKITKEMEIRKQYVKNLLCETLDMDPLESVK